MSRFFGVGNQGCGEGVCECVEGGKRREEGGCEG